MAENFTAKQKEIVARKMGYDGPMQMFDEYLASTPSDAQRYAAVTSKFAERMAKGGMVVGKASVKKFAVGGDVDKFGNPIAQSSGNPFGEITTQQVVYGPDGKAYGNPAIARNAGVNQYYREDGTAYPVQQPQAAGGPTTTPISTVAPDAGAPTLTAAPSYTAATTAVTDAMRIASPTAPAAAQATPEQITEAATATPSAPVTAATVAPTFAAPSIAESLAAMPAVKGAVSDAATVKAVTQEPTTTAVGGVEAAQATATTVAPVAERTVQAGEMVAGPAVDMAKVEESLAKTQAAQGVVAEEMTVQGQLNKLLTNFDAGKPPAWAAASCKICPIDRLLPLILVSNVLLFLGRNLIKLFKLVLRTLRQLVTLLIETLMPLLPLLLRMPVLPALQTLPICQRVMLCSLLKQHRLLLLRQPI